MRMNLDHVASGHFVLTWERRSLRVRLLAIVVVVVVEFNF